MLLLELKLIFILNVVYYALTERKIRGGVTVTENKRYMVQLCRAPSSPRDYDTWLCGGALVTNTFIVSSAACVEDVQHIYAIAGYSKRVTNTNLDIDNCAKAMKKKIIYTCVPKAYEFGYDSDKWAYIDIAMLKVESPYDFNSSDWGLSCSYNPVTIPINYESINERPGLDTMVYGWGHLSLWRELNGTKDFNQDVLHYAPTRISNKKLCKEFFKENMADLIDKYMICTIEPGHINEKGAPISSKRFIADGCTPTREKVLQGSIVCEEDLTQEPITDFRKSFAKILLRQQNKERIENGFCQNDHGGPLVTWIDKKEILIGVASVFRVNNVSRCVAPYLYTSTHSNRDFLECVINKEHSRRKAICHKSPREKGFDTIERSISWKNHPQGPADNERVQIRPQISLNYYNLHLHN